MIRDALGFEQRYTVRVLGDVPGSRTATRFGISRRGPIAPNGMMLEILPESSPPWVGVFEQCADDYPLTGVFGTPSRCRLCVLNQGAGYIVSAYEASDWEAVVVLPVLRVHRVPEKALLLFNGFTDLAAYGSRGLEWVLDTLSVDDLEVSDVTADSISGSARDPLNGERIPFQVDAMTGALEGGSRLARLRRRSDLTRDERGSPHTWT